MTVEFKAWSKITRDNPLEVTITEKMDGTNACIIIEKNEIVGVQSRKRLITVKYDNYGFAKWVDDNKEDLLSLGNGYHYGEWVGEGIHKNPHKLEGKHFYLFNSYRWNKEGSGLPSCCDVVRILFVGELTSNVIPKLLEALKDEGEKLGTTPEGIIAYHHALRGYTKHTIKSPNGKWCK